MNGIYDRYALHDVFSEASVKGYASCAEVLAQDRFSTSAVEAGVALSIKRIY